MSRRVEPASSRAPIQVGEVRNGLVAAGFLWSDAPGAFTIVFEVPGSGREHGKVLFGRSCDFGKKLSWERLEIRSYPRFFGSSSGRKAGSYALLGNPPSNFSGLDIGSRGRTRTFNPTVNSRVLYH